MGATIYFDNLQSGEVAQLLSSVGHHTVGLKLHRRGDRSPEPGQAWTHEATGPRSPEVVLVSTGWQQPGSPVGLLAQLAPSAPCSPGSYLPAASACLLGHRGCAAQSSPGPCKASCRYSGPKAWAQHRGTGQLCRWHPSGALTLLSCVSEAGALPAGCIVALYGAVPWPCRLISV